ncbi:hypothetical protein T265_00443 [Opisthorchis viverrini]|uniref:Uncharacterized protein n=1 Tax=Opisthorchis viverrini TaxID=6198 RepID=A0A075AJP9_OPIVI|nr:hypothetical protein T265_00443 [Opisthorchis viverrini]KER33764.1 hypothetical protein T265_00443 [Opisthorchis viverrini]
MPIESGLNHHDLNAASNKTTGWKLQPKSSIAMYTNDTPVSQNKPLKFQNTSIIRVVDDNHFCKTRMSQIVQTPPVLYKQTATLTHQTDQLAMFHVLAGHQQFECTEQPRPRPTRVRVLPNKIIGDFVAFENFVRLCEFWAPNHTVGVEDPNTEPWVTRRFNNPEYQKEELG